jgi:phage gp36-like protein
MAAIDDYCSLDDVAGLGIGSQAIRKLPPADVKLAIRSVSRFIDTYLRAAEFPLPLSAVGEDIKQTAAVLVAWRLKVHWYNPDVAAHALLEKDYDNAVTWLKGVANGSVVPDLTDLGGAPEEVSPQGVCRIITTEQRGWSSDLGGVNDPGAFVGRRR